VLQLTELFTEKYLKKLMGRTDIEDALKRLDRLTQEEARMAAAQVLKVANTVDDRVQGIANNMVGVHDGVDQMTRSSFPNNVDTGYTGSSVLTGNQLRQDLHTWLSPPDPSTNHNIACSAHHEGTATWFFRGSIYQDWKSTGSLLWVHGKRESLSHSCLTPSDKILSV
jgi:hypothetical protein